MSKMIEMSKLLVDMVDLIYLIYKIVLIIIIIIIINIFFNQTVNGPKFPSPKLVIAMPKK
jgi:hypothetical protein